MRTASPSHVDPEAKANYLDFVLRCFETEDADFETFCVSRQPRIQGALRSLHRRFKEILPPASAPPVSLQSAQELLDPLDVHPQRVGNYRILGVLGEGGMGTVYRAQQTIPVRRRVALKLVRRGMDTREVVARFEAERQVLASLDHPHVPQVYDAGTTEDGRPYFVMELVCGPPITTFCDRHRLSIKERLSLFAKVCDAMRHAHMRGVIHRDIKPTNILVVQRYRGAVPKIIDFGVSKAAHRATVDIGLATRFGQLIGTPAYMSPEQAEMTNRETDARTDVYSLGVLLYELLVGVLPHDPESLRGVAFGDLPRILRECDTSKPSTRIDDPELSDDIVPKRQTDTRSLRSQLRGDLDWITMKAMAKESDSRYECAADLAADVRRYLANEPVMAGPPRLWYRLKKHWQKHRSQIVCAVALTALLIGNLVMAWYLLQA